MLLLALASGIASGDHWLAMVMLWVGDHSVESAVDADGGGAGRVVGLRGDAVRDRVSVATCGRWRIFWKRCAGEGDSFPICVRSGAAVKTRWAT